MALAAWVLAVVMGVEVACVAVVTEHPCWSPGSALHSTAQKAVRSLWVLGY